MRFGFEDYYFALFWFGVFPSLGFINDKIRTYGWIDHPMERGKSKIFVDSLTCAYVVDCTSLDLSDVR